jgi:hypothetical protein
VTRRVPGRWLDRWYQLPNEFDTLEQFQQLHHEDLPLLTLKQREDQRIRLRIRLSFEENPNPWFQARLRRPSAARGLRGGRR